MSQVGIKLANNDFFPIIENTDSLPIKREIELTTVRDGQATVQIHLYKKDEVGEKDLTYVGTLIIEDLKESPQGSATISLSLSLNEDNHLSAEAIDKETDGKQSLAISLNNLNSNNLAMFDFDLDEPIFKDTTKDIGDVSDIDLSFTDILDNDTDDSLSTAIEDDDSFFADEFSFGKESNSDVFSEDLDTYSDNEDITPSLESTFDENVFVEESQNEDTKDYAINDEMSPDPYVDDLDNLSNKKSSFPKWLKIFLIILFVSVLALVTALILKNVLKSKKTVSTQGFVVAERETEKTKQDVIIEENTTKNVTEEVEIEQKKNDDSEVRSIDSITETPPQKTKEPFEQKSKTKEEDKKDENLEEINSEKVSKDDVKEVKSDATKRAVNYKLKSGDTLWDLAETFYKNPWKYKKIARYNGIKDPNHIIVGRNIIIPAK